jgi:hypothetical protein
LLGSFQPDRACAALNTNPACRYAASVKFLGEAGIMQKTSSEWALVTPLAAV